MALTFTRAQTVSEGQAVNSRQMRSLAAAFNDRIRSGIGDSAWRIGMWWYNLFRQVRNPSEDGNLFPPQAEFHEVYQHVSPDSGVQWPVTDPGEAEGANLACPSMAFPFGNPDVSDEPTRIVEPEGIPIWLGTQEPQSLEDYWLLGKYQRGAVVPDAGVQNVPAFTAAQSYLRIVTPLYSPHLKTYGGYFPQPVQLLSECGTTEETGSLIQSFEIKFTAVREDVDTSSYHGTVTAGPVVTYAGTCPLGTDYTATGHVLAIFRGPLSFYVYVNNGTDTPDLDIYPRADWIEGPYTGEGQLDRRDGDQLNVAVNAFVSEFRGTDDQRADDASWRIRDVAFDFGDFMTRQYYLSPNLGRMNGDEIEALYPQAVLTGATSFPDGTEMVFPEGTVHTYREGYVLAGVFAKSTKLTGTASVKVWDGSTLLGSLRLTPDGSGASEGMLWLKECPSPSLRVTVDGATFSDTDGTILFEATEQFEYKPQFWDAYLLLRHEASIGGDITQGGIDGSGQDQLDSPGLFQKYIETGCIVNLITPGVRDQAPWVTDNPVYEAARKMSRDQFHIVTRNQLVDYAITGGKPILRFKRYLYGDSDYDAFYGIAPSNIPRTSGDLVKGEEYVVRETDGHITYRGTDYHEGERFTATTVPDFTETGDAKLFVYDGIVSTPLEHRWSNEWVMFLQTKVYHPSDSSLFKTDVFADYYAWMERCHFYSGTMFLKPRLKRHMTYNTRVQLEDRGDDSGFNRRIDDMNAQADLIVVEAPTGYRYAEDTNFQPNTPDDFFPSCQIYQKPYDIESATIEYEDGIEIVKLTFKERFHHHPSAPSSLSSDVTTWDPADLSSAVEPWRTDDNALREYLLHRYDPGYQCEFRLAGDAGGGSSVYLLPDNPFGSCYPHFMFTKLLPFPYEDGNAVYNLKDSRTVADVVQQAAMQLIPMCEGFIDDRTSIDLTCYNGIGSLYDYKLENLCFDAFGGNNLGPISLEDRSDNPWGVGPLPNTPLYAETFNRVAQCVNLLTRARIMLPFSMECRTQLWFGQKEITPDKTSGDSCDPSGTYRIAWSGSPPPMSAAGSFGSWTDCAGVAVSQTIARINLDDCPSDPNKFFMASDKNVSQWRVSIDSVVLEALPSHIRDELETLGGFVARKTREVCKPVCTYTETFADSQECCAPADAPCPFFWWGSDGYKDCECEEIENAVSCFMADSGQLDAGDAPGGLFIGGHSVSLPPEKCGNTSIATDTVEIMSDPGFFITVPLTDLP